MKHRAVLLSLSCLGVLLSLTGCALVSVKLKPISPKSSKAEKKEFYKRHRIVSRIKSNEVRLGDGTRIRLLSDLRVLVSPKSETALAIADYERVGRYTLITLGVGGGLVVAGLGLTFFGILGPIQNRSRRPVILTGFTISATAALGTIGWIIGLIIVANGKRANERILRHYNDDLRANLKLPPRKKKLRWQLPPTE